MDKSIMPLLCTQITAYSIKTASSRKKRKADIPHVYANILCFAVIDNLAVGESALDFVQSEW
jgi:hypothetical protein